MILEVNGLSKNFGGLKAVEDVSFNVGHRAIQSIIGPNGAGKTTLFNLITGSIPPVSGYVRFDGRDVTHMRTDLLAKQGLVRTFQRTSIFANLTLLENVALAVRSRRGIAAAALVPAGLEGEVEDEAHTVLEQVGLAGRERMTAAKLAHGAQRSLDIAIGLALRPRLILMDEPMAGMSRGDREKVAELVLRLRDEFDLTVVIVEHDIGMVMRLSDSITVMQHGRVIAHGSPAEIRDDPAVKKAYLSGSYAT